MLKKAGEILDESNWEQWHCAILIESDEAFFDSASDEVPLEIREELRQEMGPFMEAARQYGDML